jgi:hypothetical protein
VVGVELRVLVVADELDRGVGGPPSWEIIAGAWVSYQLTTPATAGCRRSSASVAVTGSRNSGASTGVVSLE